MYIAKKFIGRHNGRIYLSNSEKLGGAKVILEKHPNGTIVADAVVNNPASVKILTKLGFSKTRVEEKGFKNNGVELDIIHFNL